MLKNANAPSGTPRRAAGAAALVLAVVGLAGCGSSPPQSAPSRAATDSASPSSAGTPSASASTTPSPSLTPSSSISPSLTPAAGSPTTGGPPLVPRELSGDWTTDTGGLGLGSDGTGNGQTHALYADTVTFTRSGATYTVRATSPLVGSDLATPPPPDAVIATFHAIGGGFYEGRAAIWDFTHDSATFAFWVRVSVEPGSAGIPYPDGGPSLALLNTGPLTNRLLIVFHRGSGSATPSS